MFLTTNGQLAPLAERFIISVYVPVHTLRDKRLHQLNLQTRNYRAGEHPSTGSTDLPRPCSSRPIEVPKLRS
jgi:hypothetical protein